LLSLRPEDALKMSIGEVNDMLECVAPTKEETDDGSA